MSDYIYLLENRLSPAQRSALVSVRDVARQKGLTIFLVGGAVRDLTSGSPVRDLDVVVQGNASKLKKELEKAGGTILGELDAAQTVFLRFPGSVRMEFGSTVSVTYPKPGKAVVKLASIQEDLRRRDFTANAMALSLNDGSYGLLMDPLNGVADIENRELRLVSNYGFIEDPVRMIRAARLRARLGWTLEEKTESRYQTGREENYIAVMPEYQRGFELEDIFHEEDPLRILKGLEAEAWMKVLAPYWTSAKVNVVELERMREAQTQLQMQSINPDTAAANFPMLTAKLSAKEISTLKASFPRPGFVAEIDSLEARSREFVAQLSGKSAAQPSQIWKLITAASPEVVLWTSFSTKSAPLQAKFKSFSTEWPLVRSKMPYTMMQEMRIVPELAGYEDLLEKLFFELMDGHLGTPEEMKAFLEPYSPPAPPPPVSMRRARAVKKEAKPAKSRSKKAVPAEELADVAEKEDSDAPKPVVAAVAAEAAPVSEPVAKASVKTAAKEAVKTVAKPTAKAVVKKAAPPVKASLKPAPAAAKKAPVKVTAGKAPVKVVTKKAAVKVAAAKKAAAKVAPPAKKATPGKQVPAKLLPVKKGKPVSVKASSRPAKSAPAKAVKATAKKATKTPAKALAAKAPSKAAKGAVTGKKTAEKIAAKGGKRR